MNRTSSWRCRGTASLLVVSIFFIGAGRTAAEEPDYRTAAGWWKELPKKWTPVGWKNHLMRFNVLFNGAVLARPDLNPRTAKWADQGMLLWPSTADPADDGTIRQGYRTDHDAPVLWTDWNNSPYDGAKALGHPLRQEIFAHIREGKDVATGDEPLFAWMRLDFSPLPLGEGASSSPLPLGEGAGVRAAGESTIAQTPDGPRPKGEGTKTFSYKLYAPAIEMGMWAPTNLKCSWKPYPRPLVLNPAADAHSPAMLMEPDGKVRLAAIGGKGVQVALRIEEGIAVLTLTADLQQAGHVDLLLPLVPCPRDIVEKEQLLGYDGALAEADAYWRKVPATAASIDVPEPEVNRAIQTYLKMAEAIAEKNPATGEYCSLTGSCAYPNVWATPNSMTFGFLLSPMGYHAQAERYLAIFKKRQGSLVPPGKAFQPHPGYLGTPAEYHAVNWLSDNGALLWAMSQHALLSRDAKFVEDYTPAIIKSCEWVRDARRIAGHGGIEGILPPAVATDEQVQVQSTWNDGWNYKGLATAVRLLKRIGHSRAAEFEAEARDYRERFRAVFAAAMKKAPTWTDAGGKVHRIAPRCLWGAEGTDPAREAFYLDCGPLFLVFAGLMDADDEAIRSSRQWFRENPAAQNWKDDGICFKPPSLQHEISSCEPCYSWVYFHSWQQGDRPKFLEGMYSLFSGASSRQTYTVCETRSGVSGLTPCLPNVWLARLAAIDDQICEDELHLLRLMPLAWLRCDKEASFLNMPTEFGAVDLTAGLSRDGRELRVTFSPKFEYQPKRVLLHVPPVAELTTISLNGKPLSWDGRTATVEIAANQPAAGEPDYRTAAGWWKELPKKWTPVGWKNHLFRYNVLFNGAVVANPCLSEPSKNLKTDYQDMVMKTANLGMVFWPSLSNPADDGTIRQGWKTDRDAPVLWTDWSSSSHAGAKESRLRPYGEIFAHVPGSADVKAGNEPLFAWTRLSISPLPLGEGPGVRAADSGQEPAVGDRNPIIGSNKSPNPNSENQNPSHADPHLKTLAKGKGTYAFSCKIYSPNIGLDMDMSKNLKYVWEPYIRKLTLQPPAPDGAPWLLVEPNGKVRLAVLPEKGCRVSLSYVENVPQLEIELDLRQTNRADLLLPMIPCPREIVERECALGRDKALAEADAYWRVVPATAARIDVPEPEINEAIRTYLKLAEVVAEKNPATGEYTSLTGSWMYADICATPNSMTYGFLLDPMGYHRQVERYLAIFKRCQGQRIPPGNVFQPHPGYLGTPTTYFSTPWISDNGALLWAMARHALLSRDEKFIKEYTPVIVKSCEWIRDARRMTGHGGIEGILPSGWATDERQAVQSSWNDGWNYLGLTTAVRLLKRINHSRAAEFEAEARQYRERFRAVFAEVAEKTPAWTDAAGKVHKIAPRSLSGDKEFGAGKDPFYLDCGPMFLSFAGLMDPEDELIASSRLWFREGPPRATYRDNGDPAQPPSLEREISSCEPCYSWNIFDSWRLGDRTKFFAGMYSLFAGGSSQQTYTVCESRGGIAGMTPLLPNVWFVRLAAIDDQICEDELHLLRLMPLAWLRPDKTARFENMPTEFGVVGLAAKLSEDRRELQVTFTPQFECRPKRIVLHVPPVEGLSTVRLNGKPLAWDGKSPTLEIQN